jgi:WD40 repeat protein
MTENQSGPRCWAPTLLLGLLPAWAVAQEKQTDAFKGHDDRVWCLAFSRDGKMLASGSADTTIKLWDAATGNALATLTGHTHWVISVAFSPDGKTLASGSWDPAIKLFDVATGK